jgi:hypothetical protein
MGFTAGEAIRFGWETFKRRPWFFVGSTLIIMLVSGLIDAFTRGIDAAVSGSADQSSLLGSLISLLAGTLINMGATAFYSLRMTIPTRPISPPCGTRVHS